jgi:hypothetical protein
MTSSTGAAGVAPGRSVPPALGLILLLAMIMARAIPALRTPIPLDRASRRPATVLLILLIFWFAACGTGGGASDQGTPAGTYELTIQGRSGSFTSTTSLTLIIR